MFFVIVPLLTILGILYVRVSFGEECLPQLEHFFLILIHTTVFIHTTERLRVKHLVLNWENWFPAMEFRLYSLIMRYFNLYLFLGVLQAEPRGGQWGHANKSRRPTYLQYISSKGVNWVDFCFDVL